MTTPEDQTLPRSKSAPEGHWRVRLLLSYDGTEFAGWQRQTQQTHLKTIQGSIEEALLKIYGRPIHILGASRTDTGVHALGQVAHFDSPKDPESFNLRYALQSLLRPNIVPKAAWLAPPDFHAIGHSVKKTYKYHILNREVPSALRYQRTHWVRFPLDVAYLNELSQVLVGRQDFKSFQTTGTVVKTTVREIFSASWERKPHDTLVFTVTGNGFLKQMVRNLVGTLIDLAQERATPERLREILDAKDRRLAGASAPAQGLYLYRVYYPEDLDNKCRKL